MWLLVTVLDWAVLEKKFQNMKRQNVIYNIYGETNMESQDPSIYSVFFYFI